MKRMLLPSLITSLVVICFTTITPHISFNLAAAAPITTTRKRRLPNTTTTTTPAVVAKKSKLKKSSAWLDGLKNGLASAVAAACVKTTLQPIDAIKTMQQYHHNQAGTSSSLSVLAACRELVSRPGGFGNFYAGLSVTVLGAMPGVALYFGVYSYCKQSLGRTKIGRQHPTAVIAVSAALGNSVASFSRVPYEVLKQKLQTGVYGSTMEALRATAEQGWVRMLFPKGGVAIQMIRDVPYAVCTLLLYESFQRAYQNRPRQQRCGTDTTSKNGWDFCLGGLAGGIGSWVTNPMDVVKTRLQTNSDLYHGSVIECTRSIWVEGGASAFLRGSVPRLMHKVRQLFSLLLLEFF
jgi:solute carrier family 25 (mitochondrial S-adenosylmethionine transporter), member 26